VLTTTDFDLIINHMRQTASNAVTAGSEHSDIAGKITSSSIVTVAPALKTDAWPGLAAFDIPGAHDGIPASALPSPPEPQRPSSPAGSADEETRFTQDGNTLVRSGDAIHFVLPTSVGARVGDHTGNISITSMGGGELQETVFASVTDGPHGSINGTSDGDFLVVEMAGRTTVTVSGGAGNGFGNDTIFLDGTGNAKVDGGEGNDSIFVGHSRMVGDITIDGGAGADTVQAWIDLGTAELAGGLGDDRISATIAGGVSATVLGDANGISGDDRIEVVGGGIVDVNGNAGLDTIIVGNGISGTIGGGDNSDLINVYLGSDDIVDANGGRGRDTIVVGAGDGTLRIDGGGGNDELDVRLYTGTHLAVASGLGADSIVCDTETSVVITDFGSHDRLELVHSGGQAQAISARVLGGDLVISGAITLQGAADELVRIVIRDTDARTESIFERNGTDGTAILRGGDGNDVLLGGIDRDQIVAGTGNDSVEGNAGDDTFRFEGDGALTGDDKITGGAGIDTLIINGDVSIAGEGGTSNISNIEAIRVISGDVTLNIANATFASGVGAIDASGANSLALDASAVTRTGLRITASSSADTVLGGHANDVIEGGSGRDSLDGGAGGADTLTGGGDSDTFHFDAGDSDHDNIDAIIDLNLDESDKIDVAPDVAGAIVVSNGTAIAQEGSNFLDASKQFFAAHFAGGHSGAEAGLFTFQGHTYLAIDLNDDKLYTQDHDLIIDVTGLAGQLDATDFI